MDIVEEQVNAYNAKDLERFIATYSPSVVIEDGENNVLMRGHAEMRERYGPLFEGNPQLHSRIITRLRIGKFTLDEEEITGSKSSATPIRSIVIYRVEKEKIVHVRMLR